MNAEYARILLSTSKLVFGNIQQIEAVQILAAIEELMDMAHNIPVYIECDKCSGCGYFYEANDYCYLDDSEINDPDTDDLYYCYECDSTGQMELVSPDQLSRYSLRQLQELITEYQQELIKELGR